MCRAQLHASNAHSIESNSCRADSAVGGSGYFRTIAWKNGT
jgi:hypothetical protein